MLIETSRSDDEKEFTRKVLLKEGCADDVFLTGDDLSSSSVSHQDHRDGHRDHGDGQYRPRHNDRRRRYHTA